jgi:DNA-directed RNA polymerase subunit H (RpoH/RPB5)
MILYVLSFRENSLPKVHVKDISSAHLISYHPDRDLLPMILYVLSFRENSLPKVHVKDISSAHLISYHPDRDLLPMILYVLSFRENSLPKVHVRKIKHKGSWVTNLCLGGNLSNGLRICPLHGPLVNCSL